jgi:hypothetical protein
MCPNDGRASQGNARDVFAVAAGDPVDWGVEVGADALTEGEGVRRPGRAAIVGATVGLAGQAGGVGEGLGQDEHGRALAEGLGQVDEADLPVARASIRFASAVVGTDCSSVVSLGAEGFLEPFRADVGIDLGVDDHRAVAPLQPGAQELEVGDAARGDALAAGGARERSEVRDVGPVHARSGGVPLVVLVVTRFRDGFDRRIPPREALLTVPVRTRAPHCARRRRGATRVCASAAGNVHP